MAKKNKLVHNKQSKPKNYAFIDGQNLNLGIRELGWKLDWKRFRVYLRFKYNIETAYYFIGYMPSNHQLYTFLQSIGYILVFKSVISTEDGMVKGNCDADLVLRAMIDIDKYDKAVIVSSDGDFCSLVQHLRDINKLQCVLAPNLLKCSSLLKKSARKQIDCMNNLQHKLQYKKGRMKRTS